MKSESNTLLLRIYSPTPMVVQEARRNSVKEYWLLLKTGKRRWEVEVA
jgi:hypothetical protein